MIIKLCFPRGVSTVNKSYQFLHVGDIFKNLPIESIFKKAQICFEGSHDIKSGLKINTVLELYLSLKIKANCMAHIFSQNIQKTSHKRELQNVQTV